MYAFIVTMGLVGQVLTLVPFPLNLPAGICHDGIRTSLSLNIEEEEPFLFASAIMTLVTIFFYLILAGILFVTTLRLAATGCAVLAVVHLATGSLMPIGLDIDQWLLGVPFHLQMILGLAWIVRALLSHPD